MKSFGRFGAFFGFFSDLFDSIHYGISEIFYLLDLSLVLTTSFWRRRLFLFFFLEHKSVLQKVVVQISYLLIIMIMSTMRTSLNCFEYLDKIDFRASGWHLVWLDNFLIQQFKRMVLRLTFLSFFCLLAYY
mgnify:FL=1